MANSKYLQDWHKLESYNCPDRRYWQRPFTKQRSGKKNIYFAKSKSNYNTNIIGKDRGGFPEGQTPIMLGTLSNAEYNIKY